MRGRRRRDSRIIKDKKRKKSLVSIYFYTNKKKVGLACCQLQRFSHVSRRVGVYDISLVKSGHLAYLSSHLLLFIIMVVLKFS